MGEIKNLRMRKPILRSSGSSGKFIVFIYIIYANFFQKTDDFTPSKILDTLNTPLILRRLPDKFKSVFKIINATY